MYKIFSIFGYGVPKNILKDGNFNRYLSFAFNQIFDRAAGEKAVIIFSGGHTDCYRPFRRAEAEEMKKLFLALARRELAREKTRDWKYVLHKKPISTLENILYLAGYFKKNGIAQAQVNVLCEFTRRKRIGKLLRKVNEDQKLRSIKFSVVPIDFDITLNRYLDKRVIAKREREGLKEALEAIKSRENLLKHVKEHQERLNYLRTHDSKHHVEVVRDWWEK